MVDKLSREEVDKQRKEQEAARFVTEKVEPHDVGMDVTQPGQEEVMAGSVEHVHLLKAFPNVTSYAPDVNIILPPEPTEEQMAKAIPPQAGVPTDMPVAPPDAHPAHDAKEAEAKQGDKPSMDAKPGEKKPTDDRPDAKPDTKTSGSTIHTDKKDDKK